MSNYGMKANIHSNFLKSFLRKGMEVGNQKYVPCSFEYPIVESTAEQDFCAIFINSCEPSRKSFELKRAWLR